MDDIDVLTHLVAGAKLFASGKNDPKRPRVAGWGKQAASSSDDDSSSSDEELPHKEGTPAERAIVDKAIRILNLEMRGVFDTYIGKLHLDFRFDGSLTDQQFAQDVQKYRLIAKQDAMRRLESLQNKSIPWHIRVEHAQAVLKSGNRSIAKFPDGRPSSP